MAKIKLLFIIHSLEIGGAEGQVYELARRLNRDRYEPVVCSLTDGGPYIEKLRQEGIRVIVVGNRLRELCWKIGTLVCILRREKFLIVHNFMFTAAVIGTITARACGVPVIVNSIRSLGFLYYRYRRPVKRFVYKLCDSIVANSNETKRMLINYAIADSTKLLTIYNGVDLHRFRPCDSSQTTAALREAAGISSEHFPVVGMIANLNPVKNHECLLKAAPTIVREFPRAAFVLVGTGTLKESLKRTAHCLGVERNVFFWVKERAPTRYCASSTFRFSARFARAFPT